MKYIIITPAKNEEKYIRFTLESVCKQTILPEEWIIVDDGSTDSTPFIVQEYAEKYNWIKSVKIDNSSEARSGGVKVVKAFYEGYKNIVKDYQFIVKLDADITLPQNYFEIIANEFQINDKIGICGGIYFNKLNDGMYKSSNAEYHIGGAIKSYRKECFNQIGGIMPVFGWDGIDEFLAMFNGWEIKVIEDLTVIHHREDSEVDGNYKTSFKNGVLCFRIGYDPFLLILRVIKRMYFNNKFNPLNGLVLFIGYLIGIKENKLLTKAQRKFIRKFQYKRIKEKINKFLFYN